MSTGRDDFLDPGTTLRIIHKPMIPTYENKFKVMIELERNGNDRFYGADIVMVLDVSESMGGEKLEKMKTASKFVINKLSPIDRLSVVTFSNDSKMLCPLRQMTEDCRREIENLVDNLVAGGDANMTAGLETALQVVSSDRQPHGAVSLMLISSSRQKVGWGAARLPIGHLPVHTFGLGDYHYPGVLKAIADISKGGTYSQVESAENLRLAVSQCLAGLLTVSLQHLELVVTPQSKCKIESVHAGTYQQTTDRAAGSVTVSFGHLYHNETRKVMIDLLLPANHIRNFDALKITYSYSNHDEFWRNATPVFASVSRSETAPCEELEEVTVENLRIQVAQRIREARLLADKTRFFAAWRKLIRARLKLWFEQDDDNPNQFIVKLKYELDLLLDLIDSEEMYEMKGRAFALACESSHGRQRFAARGNVEHLRLFSTLLMDTYLKEDDKLMKIVTFNDDEQIVATPDDVVAAGSDASVVESGMTTLKIINKPEAPPEETQLKVMLELKGQGSGSGKTAGLDIVAVLDVSGSMCGEKLAKMKIAMKFVIKKLSPVDRLSVVIFSEYSKRLCPLRCMTKHSQTDIEKLVDGLDAEGNTNMTAGLERALGVLSGRSVMEGRVSGVLLLSDGRQNVNGDASKVQMGNFPVHTFGFGEKNDPTVLKAIADKSNGGTFSDVQNTENLSIAISQCLAGLLTVAIQDLKLFVSPVTGSKIEEVFAGTFPQTIDKTVGSVAVSFGDLYQKETRKVIVDLLLPASTVANDVLKITYSYRTIEGKLLDFSPVFATVSRSGKPKENEREEVITEDSRIQTAQLMKEARVLADGKKLEDARDKLNEAGDKLEKVQVDDFAKQFIEMLKYEPNELLNLMKSQEMYETKGRPFALSSESSHDHQRFTARGDVEKLRLFSTPRMDAYLKQAKSFNKDPTKSLPTAEEDAKQELQDNPLGPFIGTLTYNLSIVIYSLQSIQKVLIASTR